MTFAKPDRRLAAFRVTSFAAGSLGQGILAGQTRLPEGVPLRRGTPGYALSWVNNGHGGKSKECPVYPRKRTLDLSRVMSASCQKRTLRRLTKSMKGASSSARLPWAGDNIS